jgi:hypothetical protein
MSCWDSGHSSYSIAAQTHCSNSVHTAALCCSSITELSLCRLFPCSLHSLQLQLPKTFHLYLVPHSVAKFHPKFDAALMDILAKVHAVLNIQYI